MSNNILRFPKESLYTLNFFTIGHPRPVVIPTYTSQEQALVNQIVPEALASTQQLLHWCRQNSIRGYVL